MIDRRVELNALTASSRQTERSDSIWRLFIAGRLALKRLDAELQT